MSAPGRLHVVVPLYQEEPNLPRLFESFAGLAGAGLAQGAPAFLVVDDGSRDATATLAAELGLRHGLDLTVLRHEGNRGPGAAFATAFAHLAPRLREDDWVLTVEGDNTSRLELVARMFTRAAEGLDLVLASPYVYGGAIRNTVTLRVLVSYVANVFLKEALGLRGIFTMSSFFRLHRAGLVLRLQARYGPAVIERAGFECMVEMLIKATALGASLSEVPMVLDTAQRAGRSKMSVSRTTLGYLQLWRDARRWRAAAAGAGAPAP